MQGSCRRCEAALDQAISRYSPYRRASHTPADVLVTSGAVSTRNMTQLLDAFKDLPPGCRVIALGDCSIGTRFTDTLHDPIVPAAHLVPVDTEIAGCPPRPAQILTALDSLNRPGVC